MPNTAYVLDDGVPALWFHHRHDLLAGSWQRIEGSVGNFNGALTMPRSSLLARWDSAAIRVATTRGWRSRHLCRSSEPSSLGLARIISKNRSCPPNDHEALIESRNFRFRLPAATIWRAGVRQLIRTTILQLSFGSGLQHLMRWFHRDRVIIIMYHGFCRQAAELGILNLEDNHVEAKSFERQLAYLSRYHKVISLERYVSMRQQGVPLPRYSAIITMDDGYKTNYSIAFSLLKKYRVPASVFVTTGFVDRESLLWTDRLIQAIAAAPSGTCHDAGSTLVAVDLSDTASRRRAALDLMHELKLVAQESRDRILRELEARLANRELGQRETPEIFEPLSWEDIGEMIGSGLVSFGNHTHTHLILGRSEPDSQRSEIRRAHVRIESHTGQPCRSFCYPNGRREDYDATTQSILHELAVRADSQPDTTTRPRRSSI
jgi:peptidoglycan/xylan/chitin deacetylase (PgdA/CDA1 family)